MVVNLAKCFLYTRQSRWCFHLLNADRNLLIPCFYSIRPILIHSGPFRFIPVHSGIIAVHSFRYHSGPFWYYFGPFRYYSSPFRYHSGPIWYYSGPFRYHSGPFRYYSGPFRYHSGPFLVIPSHFASFRLIPFRSCV